MLMICCKHSFILMDLDNHNDFIKTTGSRKDLGMLKLLLYKWFQYYPSSFEECMLEHNLWVYHIEVPVWDNTNANYNNEEDFYHDYIVNKYDLFGYVRYHKEDLLR